jgi:protein-S-isoprenylcysteine O-methyltransferase Ste14
MSDGRAGVLNWSIRIILILFFLSLLLFPMHLWGHFYAHFTGSIESTVIKGQWLIVVLNILAFSAFLIPLGFRRKANWKEYGLVAAFFISLFIEMYGIPFAILFASRAIQPTGGMELYRPLTVDFLGVGFSFTIPMIYGAVLMIFGTALIVWGWITLYRNIGKEGLVTTGIYSVSRHPQYLGFIMVIGGWLLGWPTLLTVIFAPVLIFMYVRVCRKEEKEMGKDHDYQAYRKKAPFLI